MAHPRSIGCICCIISVALVGCRSSSRPPLPPKLVSDVRVWVGTPISGPIEGAPDVSPVLASSLHVRWVALQQMPMEALMPIDAQSRLIITPGSATALPAEAKLTRPVRFGSGKTARAFAEQLAAGRLGPTADVAADSQLVVPGATAQFSLRPVHKATEMRPHVTVLVSPHSSGPATTRPMEAVLSVRIDDPRPSGQERPSREIAVVDAIDLAEGFVVATALERPSGPWSIIAALATVKPGPTEPAAVKTLEAHLRKASADARIQRARSPLGDAPTVRSALAALADSRSVRPAMLLLTTLSDAQIAADMAMVADQSELAGLVEQTQRRVKPDAVPPLAELQWFLDRSAMQLMCEAAEKNKLSPELQSVLALHAGDVARRPDMLREMLKQVSSSAALADRLVAENLIALEDNAPAARVRAYDWLEARNKAPAGFDPFADARSRRAAIEKAMNKQGGQP